MSKYIPQINNQNFVYPNYDLAEYDVDIIHNLNENSVSGVITNFTGTSITSSSVTFSYNYTWNKDNADPVISNSNVLNLLSVHVLAPGQNYFKPWRCVNLITSMSISGTTFSGFNSFTVTPSQLGLTSFVTGTFYLEFRFIGQKAIYPVCQSKSVTI